MFQLLDLIITSPFGAYVTGAIENVMYLALVASDCDECGFNDLGKLLFGGVILAVLAGITVSLLYRRSRDSKAGESHFVSIRSTSRREEKS